ncbi:MAG TPA: Asp/Glu/hydantoin racemase [Caldithrix sp.]|nr:Asp/Glu/hydantoin racemase [Caldithrix sp.]
MYRLDKTLPVKILLIFALFLLGCGKAEKPQKRTITEVMMHDQGCFFYLNVADYPRNDKKLPIGVFDSGTGGLTVLDAIVNFDEYRNQDHTFLPQGDGEKDFGNEYFIYLGDQANMPYGNYAHENKVDLLKEHIFKDVGFLLGNKYYLSVDKSQFHTDKEPVKAIVIACNTATAYGKKDIETFLQNAGLEMKVIGVIDAGVRGALKALGKDTAAAVGVMATAGTVASGGYVRALKVQLNARKFSREIPVFQQAGIGLAGAIDGSPEYIDPSATKPRPGYKGPSEKQAVATIDLSILNRYGFDWDGHHMLFSGDRTHPENLQINSVGNYISYHLTALLEKIRRTPGTPPLKAIILGCTHYPFYRQVFRRKLQQLYNYRESGKYIYRPFMAKKIVLVDPAENTAKELYEYLKSRKMFNRQDLAKSEFYISLPNRLNPEVKIDSAGNFTYEYKYGREAGYIQEYVKRVPFSKKSVAPEVVHRLSRKIPETFRLIEVFNRENPKTRLLEEIDRF